MKRVSTNNQNVEINFNDLLIKIQNYDASVKDIIRMKDKNGEPIFSTNNIVGEWSELMICEKFNLTQEIASKEGYDAKDAAGNRYQIKSRFCTTDNARSGQNEFSSIHKNNNGEYPFEYLIMVIFEDSLLQYSAYKINSNDIDDCLLTKKASSNKKIKIRYNKKKFDDLVKIQKMNKYNQ